MKDLKIFISTHGTAAVVFFLANDVDFGDIKGVCGANNRANIKIVFKVFDGDFEGGTRFVQFDKDLFICEAFIWIN